MTERIEAEAAARMTKKKTYRFSISGILNSNNIIEKAFWGTLLAMIVTELTGSLAVMIDGLILARCIGGYAIAAHGLSGPYTQLIKLLGGFFATGIQVVCSRKIGKTDLEGANRFFTFEFGLAMLITILIGGAVSVFSGPLAMLLGAQSDITNLYQPTSDYLRGLGIGLPFTVGTTILIPVAALNGDKKRIMISTQTMMIVNIAGDLLNVFVFRGGMLGMALATSFSYLCSFVILLLHFRKNTGIHFSPVKNGIASLPEAAKAGLLPSLTRACSFVKSYLMNIIYLTCAGTAVLAANSLVQNNVKAVFICVAMGIGQTTLLISSILFGEEDKRGLKQMFRGAVRISFGPCLIITALVFAFAPQILSIFGAGEYMALAVQALRIFILGFPFIGIKMFYIYYFQGTHNTVMSAMSSILGECVLIVLSSLVLWKCFGTLGLWIAYPAAEILYLLIVFVICWIHCGHFPRSLEDLLLLPRQFDVPDEDKLDYTIYSGEEAVRMSEAARQFCLQHGIPEGKAYYVSLAIEELAFNIFKHGADDGKKHCADLKVVRKENSIIIRLRDNCRAFNPKEKAAMLEDDNKTKGIGLRLMLKIESHSDDVKLDYVSLLNLNNLIVEIQD